MPDNTRSFTYDSVIEQVERVPFGRVATYGQIAAIVGCTARQVGYALATLPIPSPVPWHRIVNSRGQISLRSRGDGQTQQRDLLEEEGIVFARNGSINLDVYGYMS